jgi:hypothetical protein
MSAAVLSTCPPLWRRAWRAIRIALLNADIRDTERYVKACEEGGLATPQELADQRARLEALRCTLAVVERSA